MSTSPSGMHGESVHERENEPQGSSSGHQLYTIGYQQTSLADFLEKLTSESIELVLDVREVAWSRRVGFSGKQIAASLNQKSIEYIHEPKLGTPRNIRQRYKVSGDPISFRDEYAQHLATLGELMESYADLIGSKRVCLLCFEREPELCHRSILSERFRVTHGWDEIHL
jgi:uncharacterized protein (DUF488 family)